MLCLFGARRPARCWARGTQCLPQVGHSAGSRAPVPCAVRTAVRKPNTLWPPGVLGTMLLVRTVFLEELAGRLLHLRSDGFAVAAAHSRRVLLAISFPTFNSGSLRHAGSSFGPPHAGGLE